MKVPESKLGAWIAAAYLLLVLSVSLPLLIDAAIHHGNGIPYLALVTLTLPLSWVSLRLLDLVTDINAFYMTGIHYYLAMSALYFCAFINAAAMYRLILFIRRKRARAIG